jgi:hypothetical protein
MMLFTVMAGGATAGIAVGSGTGVIVVLPGGQLGLV